MYIRARLCPIKVVEVVALIVCATLLNVFIGFQLRADLVKFSTMLTQLQLQPVFQLIEFEGTVEFIRNAVAQVYVICICILRKWIYY